MPENLPPPILPDAAEPDKWQATRFVLSCYLWGIFITSCYNGCTNGERLTRIENQQRELRAIIESQRPTGPRPPEPHSHDEPRPGDKKGDRKH